MLMKKLLLASVVWTVLADSAVLGTVRQSNPKDNDLKHSLDAACKTRHCAGGWRGMQRRTAHQIESTGRSNKQNTILKLQIGQKDSNICPAGGKKMLI